MSEQTGATGKTHWIIAADPDFTRMEGGAVITTGATVYGDGYRIVPADAVCIDRATADTAAEACAITATRIDNLIRLGQDQDGDTEAAERYRAAAAVLRGGGGG